jgi:hypothetical protein
MVIFGGNNGRLFCARRHFGRVLVLILGLISSSFAFGIDTSTCGFMLAEMHAAGAAGCTGLFYCTVVPGDGPNCAVGNVWVKRFAVSTNAYQGALECDLPCSCSSQPDIAAGATWGGGASGHCLAGCQMGPTPGSGIDSGVCVGPVGGATGAQWCVGPQHPTGANCDPLATTNPPDPEPPTICMTWAGGEDCLTPLVPPPTAPPEICATRDGNSVGCTVPNTPCAGNTNGYVCAGNPPPAPPTPTPPNVTQPPDITVGGVSISGSSGTNITVVVGPPPGPPQTACPPGSTGSLPNCTPDQNRCPDGSYPVNGRCSAPANNCPDGSLPINGQCNAGSGGNGTCPAGQTIDGSGHCSGGSMGTCPTGLTMEHGVCYFNCPGGGAPVNGECAAGFGACPNGSAPIGGQCTIGACNPALDPNHCVNPANGHAGGGGTCVAPPFCTGNEIQCAILEQEWRTRCNLEGTTAVPDDGSNMHVPSEVKESHTFDISTLDGSPWIGSSACPDFGTVVVMGVTWTLGGSTMCGFLAGLGALFQLICAFKAVKIAVSG